MKSLLSFVLTLLLTMSCFAHSVVKEGDSYKITHNWKHHERQWTCTLSIPEELYRYYQGRVHQTDNMVQYVLSDYDRLCVRSLVASFLEGGEASDYTRRDNMGNVISFVQSLRYVSDQESKGEDDYVRFPVETLVDGVGDCEDLAILAAAILNEMGYGVLLVELPDHLALAIDCDGDCGGIYYEYENTPYYYLEVTNIGWDIGQIPDDFRSSRAKLSPLVYRPSIRLKHCSYSHEAYYSTDLDVPFVIECDLENAGPGSSKDLSLHVSFITHGGVPIIDRVFAIDELREGESSTYRLKVSVPRPLRGKLEVYTQGSNFESESLKFEEVELQ